MRDANEHQPSRDLPELRIKSRYVELFISECSCDGIPVELGKRHHLSVDATGTLRAGAIPVRVVPEADVDDLNVAADVLQDRPPPSERKNRSGAAPSYAKSGR